MRRIAMKKHRILVLTMILACSASAFAMDVDIRGMLRSYTGLAFSDAAITANEQTVDLTLEGWGDQTRLVVNPYAYIGIGNEPEMGIREAYVDFFLDNADIRVGKQAVMWGQAEGAFITDIVSPRDMRSFILADFREIRKGIPAVKADYFTGPFTFEGIWIPQFVPSSMPAEDSIWQRAIPFPSGTPISFTEPSLHFENSEVFGKIRYFGPRISWEVMGGYAWTDEPFVTRVNINPDPDPTIESIDVNYGRYTVLGGSFSTSVGTTVIRGEAAAYLNKPFTVGELTSPASVTSKEFHQVQSLIGIDWSLFGTDMSAQYILAYIHNHEQGIMEQFRAVPEFGHTVTFRVQKTLLDDRLTAKVFSYLEIDPMNALVRPSLSWNIEDGVILEGGAELFFGDEDGMFGYYHDNSMVYASLRWYF